MLRRTLFTGLAGFAVLTAPFTVAVVGTVDAASTDVKINEVESNGDVTDWVELYNTGASAVDISGWVFSDNSASTYVIPAGTSVAAGGFYVIDGSAFTFGLGSGDTAELFEPDGVTLVDTFTWPTGHAAITWGLCPDGQGAMQQTTASTQGAANECTPPPTTITVVPPTPGAIIISEVAPWGSGNSSYAADWFELTNVSGAPVDISGWRVDDSSNSFTTALALTGITIVEPGESVIFLESGDPAGIASAFLLAWFAGSPPTGLRIGTYSGSGIGLSTGGDAVNIFDGSGGSQAAVSFGASPAAAPFASFDNAAGANNTTISTLSVAGVNGAFLVSTGTAAIGSPGTIEGGTTPPTTAPAPTTTIAPSPPWPGGPTIEPVDLPGLAVENLSGLTYEGSGSAAPGVLWAVLNNPGTLYRLVYDGVNWVPSDTKTLKYPDGTGNPDAEGVTLAGFASASGLFVATERNNDISGTSRNAILRFDPTVAGATINATHMWDLTADLASNGANLGLEAVTWIPDTYLVSQGLLDETSNTPYAPASYPNHGTGLFVVGVEGTGNLHVYALDLTGSTFTRVATFSSGFPGVMALEFDPDTGDFWAHCDNGCQNRTNVLRISPTTGKFAVTNTFAAPVGMPTSMNTEGFAVTPNSECANDLKPVYWSDDGDTGGFSLRRGSISCLSSPAPEISEFPIAILPALITATMLGGIVLLARRRAGTVSPLVITRRDEIRFPR